MPIIREPIDRDNFNSAAVLPYGLRLEDFEMAMRDVYDFFYDVNENLIGKHMQRLDDFLRPALMSGFLSDLITASLATHSRSLTINAYFNGHPDLIVKGVYPGDSVKSGESGVEIKATRNSGGAVDTHGARAQWMCVFVYQVDNKTEPALDRAAMRFTKVFIGQVTVDDFRRNDRGLLGTRTATLDKDGIQKLRENWIYHVNS